MSKKSDSNEINNNLKLIVKTSFIVFIGVFLSKVFTYFYRIIIARNFGPEIYGLFSLTLMVLGFFWAFSSLGFQNGLLRFIPFYRGKNQKEKIKYMVSFTSKTLLLVTIVLGIILFFLSDIISLRIFHNPGLIIFIRLFAIFIPIVIFAGTFHSIVRAYEEITWYSFIGNILVIFSQLVFLIVFIYFGLKERAIIFSYNIGFLAMLIASFFVIRKKVPEIFSKYSLGKKQKKEVVSKLFSYSWPIIFLGIVMSLFGWIDSFVIGYFKTAADVGIYNSAVTISLLLMVVPSLFLQLFFPLITKEYSKKKTVLINQISKQVGKWIFILNLPLSILMFLFPGAIINILFGPQYILAASSLRLLSIGLFFYSVFILSENLLSMIGKSKTVLLNLGIASFINIILNISLVPRYGINGAAFSTMFSYIVWSLLSFFIARKYTSITPLRKLMIRIALVSIIPTFILLFLRNFVSINRISLILLGLLFLLSYILLIFLTRCLDKNDLMILNAIKAKIKHK